MECQECGITEDEGGDISPYQVTINGETSDMQLCEECMSGLADLDGVEVQ